VKFYDDGAHEEVKITEMHENSFRLFNSADEPLNGNTIERKWINLEESNSYLPDQIIEWLNNNRYYKNIVLLITMKEDAFFEEYYVRKRIKFLNKCDVNKEHSQNVEFHSNDFFIPDVMSTDDEGYYSISLPKSKWNKSFEFSVSAPDFHEKTIGLDAFYREGPYNTKNEIILEPNRRHVKFQITKSGNITDNTFYLTYLVDSTRRIHLNLNFMNKALFTESVAVSGKRTIGSFDLNNNAPYKVKILDHISDPDHTCDELITLLIEKTLD
jgi:hypothetical protein